MSPFIRRMSDKKIKTNVYIEKPGERVLANALWDTGATRSGILESYALSMGLSPLNKEQIFTKKQLKGLKVNDKNQVKVQGISGDDYLYFFSIGIMFPTFYRIPEVIVYGLKKDLGFKVLVGMDLISKGDFAISNKDEKLTFFFRTPPSDDPIDFLRP